MTITLFALTLYGQCCRPHVVGQRIVSGISVVRIGVVVRALNLLILICYYTCSLLCLKCLFCFTCQTHFALPHGGVYLVTINRELSGVTVPYKL